MASFSNKIVTTIEVLADKSAASLKSFRQSIQEADGASAKLKAGFGQASGFIKENAAALAGTAGAALIGFAANAVASFQNLALEAGKMSDTLGISTESASRWIEVSGDIGASTESVTKAMSRLEREVAKNPAQFDALGVSIARTKSGAVDANETFLRTLEALKRIKDPTERQEAANKLLGRSWGEIAELVNGDVRAAYNSVSDAKIVSEEEVADARAFRDTLDTLRGVVEDLSNKLAKNLLPVISDIGKNVEENSETWEKGFDLLGKGIAGAARQFGLAKTPAQELRDGINDLATGTDKAADSSKAVAERLTAQAQAYEATTVAAAETAEATDEAAKAAAAERQNREELSAALLQQVEDYQAVIDAQRSATDAFYAAASATDEYTGYLAGLSDAIKDADGNQLELNKVYDEGRQKAIDVADAQVRLAEESAKAAGKTLTGAERMDTFNDAMADAAAQADGPLRQAILDYIAASNGIPAEKITDIRALMDQGKLDEAKTLIEEVSATRYAQVIVDAETQDAKDALLELGRVAEAARLGALAARYAATGQAPPKAAPMPRIGIGATGGIVTQPTMALIGEAGPEAVVPLNQMPGASPLGAGMGPTKGGDTINIYATVIEKDSARWIVEQIAKARQTMGATAVQRAVNG